MFTSDNLFWADDKIIFGRIFSHQPSKRIIRRKQDLYRYSSMPNRGAGMFINFEEKYKDFLIARPLFSMFY